MGNTCCGSSDPHGQNLKLKEFKQQTDAELLAFVQQANKEPSERLKIKIEISDLPNLEIDHATDAFCVYYEIDNKGAPHKEELGRTEVIRDELSPEFIEGFEVNYRFEKHQRFRVNVYHAKNEEELDDLTK